MTPPTPIRSTSTGRWPDARTDHLRPGHPERDRFPDPGIEGADVAGRGRPAGRPGPQRELDARGVPGRVPATRGRRTGEPRRRGPDPLRPVPGPQVVGRVRLRVCPRPETGRDRAPGRPSAGRTEPARPLPLPDSG